MGKTIRKAGKYKTFNIFRGSQAQLGWDDDFFSKGNKKIRLKNYPKGVSPRTHGVYAISSLAPKIDYGLGDVEPVFMSKKKWKRVEKSGLSRYAYMPENWSSKKPVIE